MVMGELPLAHHHFAVLRRASVASANATNMMATPGRAADFNSSDAAMSPAVFVLINMQRLLLLRVLDRSLDRSVDRGCGYRTEVA